jgi:hypothetical protein
MRWVRRSIQAGVVFGYCLGEPGAHAGGVDPRAGASLELASRMFSGRSESIGARSVLTESLRFDGRREGDQLRYFVAAGWAAISEEALERRDWTSGLGNLAFGAHFPVIDPAGGQLTVEVGLGMVVGLSRAGEGLYRRLVRNAYVHAVAMQGLWEAWLWAPGRVATFLPITLAWHRDFGRLHLAVDAEGAAALILPSREVNDHGPGRLLQGRVLPRLWLDHAWAVGLGPQVVWMPSAVFQVQTSLLSSLSVAWRRWCFEAFGLLNLDEPYGFLGHGQRIWSLGLGVAVRM